MPDTRLDQQCHHYQAPTGQRCGSPALKGEYYCYFHHIKQRKTRVLIDPEVTKLDLPIVEDRASALVALSAIIARLGANTIDTKRAGLLVYSIQTFLLALPSEPQPAATQPATAAAGRKPAADHVETAHRDSEDPALEPSQEPAVASSTASAPRPKQITITQESLLYFLRSRHCYNCNAELFPPEELTERPYPGAPPQVVEENEHIRQRLGRHPPDCSPALLLDLSDVAGKAAP